MAYSILSKKGFSRPRSDHRLNGCRLNPPTSGGFLSKTGHIGPLGSYNKEIGIGKMNDPLSSLQSELPSMFRYFAWVSLSVAFVALSTSESLAQRFPHPGRPPLPPTIHPTFRPPIPVPAPGPIHAPSYARPNATLGLSIQSGGFGMSYQSFTTSPYLYGRSIYAVPSYGAAYSTYRIILPTPNLPLYDPVYPELDPAYASQSRNSQAPGASAAQAAGISPQGPYSGTNAGDGELRPGMILSDGAQVLSVGPTNGSAQASQPSVQPTTTSTGKIKL